MNNPLLIFSALFGHILVDLKRGHVFPRNFKKLPGHLHSCIYTKFKFKNLGPSNINSLEYIFSNQREISVLVDLLEHENDLIFLKIFLSSRPEARGTVLVDR